MPDGEEVIVVLALKCGTIVEFGHPSMDSSFIQSLRTVVDDIGIVEELTDRIAYECDALSSLRAVPGLSLIHI